MTSFKFGRSSTLTFQDFMVMASTDMFWDVRHLFGANYFTLELQAALREWIKKEHFLIRDFWVERMQEKFAEFLVDSADVGAPLKSLVQWLARSVEDRENEARSTMYWRTALICLSRPNERMPSSVDRTMLRDCLVLFENYYDGPHDAAHLFLKSIDKEWVCYPDSIAPGQKDFNIRNKSTWDRTIYIECVLFYEMYVDVALGTPFNENCWQDFVLEYDRAFTDDQKRQFFEVVGSYAIEQKFVPYDGLQLPIEALLSPVPPLDAKGPA